MKLRMSGKTGDKITDKIKKLQESKTAGKGKGGNADGDGKKAKKNPKDWSDDEDDIKIDIQVNEKKPDDANKPTLSATGAGWKETEVYVNETVPTKTVTNSLANAIQSGKVQAEKEYFPSIEETLV